jgi:hypothetical protein
MVPAATFRVASVVGGSVAGELVAAVVSGKAVAGGLGVTSGLRAVAGLGVVSGLVDAVVAGFVDDDEWLLPDEPHAASPKAATSTAPNPTRAIRLPPL